MSQEIEIEYKNLLTKQEFDYLLDLFPFPASGKKQVNHYFETKTFSLKENNAALRIREKDGKYQLTLKEPHVVGLLETHDRLSKEEALSWLNGEIISKEFTEKQLANMNIYPKDLDYYGSLTTIRREIPYEDVLIVLDESSYNNQTDYEFELEAPTREIGLKQFNEIMSQNKIRIKETPNKIQRFFTTLI